MLKKRHNIWTLCAIVYRGRLTLHWQRDGKTGCGRTNRLIEPRFSGDYLDREEVFRWLHSHARDCKVCEPREHRLGVRHHRWHGQ